MHHKITILKKLKDIQRQVEICKLTASLVRENAALVAVTIKSKGFFKQNANLIFDNLMVAQSVNRSLESVVF